MNIPTLTAAFLVAVIFISIIARAFYKKRHNKGGCSCGCNICTGGCRGSQEQ